MTEDVVPDLVEPIRAYRRWHVNAEGTQLHGLYHRPTPWTVWPIDMPFRAGCKDSELYTGTSNDHTTPSAESRGHRYGFGCGIYAYKWPPYLYDAAVHDATVSSISPRHRRYIFGIVQLWGKVYEHEYGWRAEYGYPVAFYSSFGHVPGQVNEILVASVAAIYRCDVSEDPYRSDQ